MASLAMPPLPIDPLSAAVGGAVKSPTGGNPFKADLTPAITPPDILSKLTSIAKGGILTQSVPSLGGGTADPNSILSTATTSTGMGTYGNALPNPGNQGNPNAPSQQQAQAIGRALAARYGWSGPEWDALNNVAMRESGWNANAVNKSSGAYGIGQALGHGHPYNLGDAQAQIQWMLNYIKQRYGDPAAAWQHEVSQGWY